MPAINQGQGSIVFCEEFRQTVRADISPPHDADYPFGKEGGKKASACEKMRPCGAMTKPMRARSHTI